MRVWGSGRYWYYMMMLVFNSELFFNSENAYWYITGLWIGGSVW